MKYMVMECHLSYAVVMDEDGRFLKVANRNYQVGQKVTDVVEMKEPEQVLANGVEIQETTRVSKKARSWMYSVAAMAACLVLVFISVFTMDQKTYASVFLSINPQVRVDVNKKDVVVGLEAVNEDGRDLIDGYEYKKKKLDVVMDELVDLAVEKGYLIDGGTISLSFDSDDDGWIAGHKDNLCSELEGHLKKNHHMSVGVSEQCDEEHTEDSHSDNHSDVNSDEKHSNSNSSGSSADHDENGDELDDDDRDDHEVDDRDEKEDRDDDDEKSDSVKNGKSESTGSGHSSSHEEEDEDEDEDEDEEDDNDEDEDEDEEDD